MGCDIHLFVETREPGGPWRLTRVERTCPDCKGTRLTLQPCHWCRRSPGKVAGFDDRSYDTFAILAGVRNDHGFVPIAKPRGLPNDMSPELRGIASDEDGDRWDDLKAEHGAGSLGDHSFSWLTLEELLKYSWRQLATKSGIISLEEFRDWDAKGRGWPRGWCGGISGPGVRHISNAEMRALIEGGRVEDENAFGAVRHYTKVNWTDTYARCARSFHDGFIPAMVALGKPHGDVRIVFGFDS